jgi:hypothetical protein
VHVGFREREPVRRGEVGGNMSRMDDCPGASSKKKEIGTC